MTTDYCTLRMTPLCGSATRNKGQRRTVPLVNMIPVTRDPFSRHVMNELAPRVTFREADRK